VANGQDLGAAATMPMPWHRRIIAVFVAPSELFAHLSRRPDWFLPMLLGLVIVVVLMYVLFPRVILPMQEEAMMERLASQPNVSAEDMEAVQQRMGGPAALISTLVGTAIMHPLALVLQGLVFYWVFLLLGGELTYRAALSVTAYPSLIAVLGGLVSAPLRIMKESIYAGINLGVLLSTEMEGSYLHSLLVQVDFFTIWRFFVVAAGMAVIAQVSQTKARLTVGILWVAWVVLSAGAGMLGRGMFGG
jgi:hypothetical protein